MSAVFSRHPHLRMGSRTVVSELLVIALADHRISSFLPGNVIIGPLKTDGEYAFVRCRRSVYKCHVDELVEYSRPSVLDVLTAYFPRTLHLRLSPTTETVNTVSRPGRNGKPHYGAA